MGHGRTSLSIAEARRHVLRPPGSDDEAAGPADAAELDAVLAFADALDGQ